MLGKEHDVQSDIGTGTCNAAPVRGTGILGQWHGNQ